jgi:AI-2 transport protein TqsA
VPDQGWKWIVTAAGVVVVVAGLRMGAPLLVPLVVSAFVAMISYPLVAWLHRRRAPLPLAVLATLLLILAVFIGPGLVVHRAVRQFAAAAPRYQERLYEMVAGSLAWVHAQGIDTSGWQAMVDTTVLLDLVGYLLGSLAAVLSNFLLVLLVAGFLLFEAAGFPGKLQEAFGVGPAGFERGRRIVHEVYEYLLVKTGVSLATGILIGLWARLLGVDFALLWGLLAFLLNYIPNFGSILAAIPALLLAIVSPGPGVAVLLGLGYVAVNMVLGNVVEPMLLGRRLQLSPVVILVSLIFWGWVWGGVGMLLSVPITMILKIMLENSREFRWVAVLLSDLRSAAASARPGRA